MKTVYKEELRLRTENPLTLYGMSFELVEEIRKEHPEFERLRWSWFVETYADGTGKIDITVSDPYATNYENLKVAGCMVFLAILLLLAEIYL